MTHLSTGALTVLRQATVKGNQVKITGEQLERSLYEEVNEALTRIGGKWKGGKTKAHIFAYYDPAPALATIVATGEMPEKNPTDFYPTPRPVVEAMLKPVEHILVRPDVRVLEPSAGIGGIVDVVRERYPHAQLTIIEMLDINAAILLDKRYAVIQQDFLTYHGGSVEVVLMNPPFNGSKKNAYMTHIRHAHSHLTVGGRLVAIAPAGFTFGSDKASKEFREWVEKYGYFEKLPADAFKSSGTGVQTVMIVLDTDTPAIAQAPEPAAAPQRSRGRRAVPIANEAPLSVAELMARLEQQDKEGRKAMKRLRLALGSLLTPPAHAPPIQPTFFD